MSKKYIWFRNLSTEKRIDNLKKIKSNLTQLIFTKQKSTKQHINKIPPTLQASFIPSMNYNTITFQKILIIFMHEFIYSFNKFLPITSYQQNTIIKCRAYKDEKDTAFMYKELLIKKNRQSTYCCGAEELVFWSQTACVQLAVLLLTSALSRNFLSRERGGGGNKSSHPTCLLSRLNEIRFTCAWGSNCLTVIKKYDYCEKLLLHDTKILSFVLMKVWKPWDIQIKWFGGGMIPFVWC